ncbi:hypothetical protein ADT43_13285 [Yersinia pestis subsp. microtus bv. Ulegeica]|nr:hypothetical protein AC599_12105 [Yersinia pestis subsp. microtus bv. Altaica]KPD99524.1 hypothetical protein ADT43_13285 [Yersinia pestis subsp. microtus bv. Ulegeica]KPE05867.1 hypothetical protein ADT45_02405 [Yersinia pestis subsp. microtus bv. Caucasica]KPE14996.1 hypothetical protein AFL20_13760 [Yersinia pestis subsp. microtus bv. Ulegeica]KZB77653.1 hypothetical protein AVJ26_05105 [Yersinia pestis]
MDFSFNPTELGSWIYIIVFSMIYWPVVAAMCVGLIVAAVLRKRWFIIIFAVPLALIALSFITLMLM